MRRDTLLDFFQDFADLRDTFLIYDDGYRSWRYSYAEVAGAARGFAARLRAAGVGRGENVIFWSENRPEWIVALWGCLLEGVVAVPIDYRASGELVARVQRIVRARVLVAGQDVSPPPLDAQVWPLTELDWSAGPEAAHSVSRDDLVEIIFTSGATADPKGVTITHRNVLANIVPVEREVLKYRKWGGPFFPIRFLNLLPLSHMFGQAMATFIPPMLPGVTVFMRGYHPQEILRQIRSRRISVLVSVPKILEVLRDHVLRLAPEAAHPLPGQPHWLRRWWHYRRVHRLFGWKFWCFVSGAAPLDTELEEFWKRMGYVVVQGYGLTETAPIVTLNHPFHARTGTVGKPIPGVEIRIADDGEILVRGENVTQGYYQADADTASAFEDGWFHTGDIGSVDESGQLYIRGRKKEMIVTPEGLNVFPEDIEQVLNETPGVLESAVVGDDRVHAVLRLAPGSELDEIVRATNARLEEHQKIRSVSIWPGDELPRTEGTRKLKRREIHKWVKGESAPVTGRTSSPIETILAKYARGRAITPATTLDELGLSSLERVELMMELEEKLDTPVDEGRFTSATTVGELSAPGAAASSEPIEFPRWNRTKWARFLRRISLPTWILPLARVFLWVRTGGRENLRGLEGPVIFASNHQSHMDVPAIMIAMPGKWRYNIAPAMAKEFFRAHFFPEQFSRREWFTNSLNYWLAALFFNAFPLPQREAGTRQTLRYAGELVSEGISILIFPEGRRVEGEVGQFQPGIGMLASRLGVPVVPVRIDGVDKVLHPSWRMARPGRVTVTFGTPLRLEGEDYGALARRVGESVRNASLTRTS